MNKKLISDPILYRVSDLGLACVLSLYFPIISVDKSNPRKIFFNFNKSKDLDLIIEKYWSGGLKVEPKHYFSNLKILKTRIYSL